ncbi:MAG: thiopeptide-type bacteriocin biosynthesis protein, partial [Pseudonocardiaceae bacterium]
IGRMQVDTYYPEIGRFGGDAAMTAAESVFTADSAAAIAQLTHTGRSCAPHQHALTAASRVDLVISLTGGVGEGMRWLIDHVDKTPAPAREVHVQTIHLANPHDQWAALRAIPGGEHIASTWTRRRAALAAYRDTLTATSEMDLDSVLPTLLHLHSVRMVGIAPDNEQACHRLARAAALSWIAQDRGDTP